MRSIDRMRDESNINMDFIEDKQFSETERLKNHQTSFLTERTQQALFMLTET